jgi:hypothetical protein
MRTRGSLTLLFALALVGGTVGAGAAGATTAAGATAAPNAPAANNALPGVSGRVLGETAPLPAAVVYAYQLADLSSTKVLTDPKGNFLFQDLPAGLYKIIAHKPGFVPVVVMLTRTAAQNYQFVELQLTERARGAASSKEDDFWSVRARIPGDVLRDIEGAGTEEPQLVQLYPVGSGQLDLSGLASAGFRTEMQAMTGVDQIAAAGGQVSGAGVGFQGQVGQVQVGVRGSFWQLSSDALAAGGGMGSLATNGQASSVSVDLASGATNRVSVSSLTNRLMARGQGPGGMEPVDLEHYTVNWTQEVGDKGRSDFTAQYTAESNYHRQSPIDPLAIPEASRSWWVEGAYTHALSDRNTLQTGLRYREREFGLSAASTRRPGDLPVSESIDAFSRGGLRVRPAVLLEYGLYSTLSDGSLTLMPQGGIVLQLGQNWQLQGSASKRAYEDPLRQPMFLSSLYQQGDLCEQGSEACYRVGLERQFGEDESFSLSATHREIGETLRLYFNEEMFDRFESLYLVQGDEIPEMRMEITKRLTPKVLTRLESSLATGGGGTFMAADRRAYENKVQYMVTSLDTQFLDSSTGVFVAFHQISQELEPMGNQQQGAQIEVERLRLRLTQDLGFLMDLAADWAVQLNMELSRGPMSSADGVDREDEVRRRLMGGIAVKF